MGIGGYEEGDRGPHHLLHRRDRLHLDPVRVQDGGGRHRGRDPRRRGHRRDLLADRVPGHPGHCRGRPDRARLFALRHRRRLRPDPGQLPRARRLGADHLLGDGQPVHEPDPGPVNQHIVGRHHPGPFRAGGRLLHPGGHLAPGLRSGAGHRADQRRLLLDLHRLAAAGPHEGARAPLHHHPPAHRVAAANGTACSPHWPPRPWPAPGRAAGGPRRQGGHRRDPAGRRFRPAASGGHWHRAGAPVARPERRQRPRPVRPRARTATRGRPAGSTRPAGRRPPPRPRKGKGKGKGKRR